MGIEPKPKLTAEDVRNYIEAAGTHCPFCGSEDALDYGTVDLDAECACQQVVCRRCQRQWQDKYRQEAIVHGAPGADGKPEWHTVERPPESGGLDPANCAAMKSELEEAHLVLSNLTDDLDCIAGAPVMRGLRRARVNVAHGIRRLEKAAESAGLCEACGGLGWLLQDNCEHGLRVERCDECGVLASDEAAYHEALPVLGAAVEQAKAGEAG